MDIPTDCTLTGHDAGNWWELGEPTVPKHLKIFMLSLSFDVFFSFDVSFSPTCCCIKTLEVHLGDGDGLGQTGTIVY